MLLLKPGLNKWDKMRLVQTRSVTNSDTDQAGGRGNVGGRDVFGRARFEPGLNVSVRGQPVHRHLIHTQSKHVTYNRPGRAGGP